MKRVFISLLCLAVFTMLYACSSTENETGKTAGIRFERLSQDGLSDDLEGKIDQSREEEGYELIVSENENYIVVYAGEYPTAGYSIEIISIAEEEGKIKVTVKETSPAEGDMTAQVLTYPFDAAKLGSAISGIVEVEFVKDNAE